MAIAEDTVIKSPNSRLLVIPNVTRAPGHSFGSCGGTQISEDDGWLVAEELEVKSDP